MNTTRPGLDRIETASRDEIAALQLQRMQWSLRHVGTASGGRQRGLVQPRLRR